MGAKSHLTPGEFSQQFNDFLKRVVLAKGGRPTARWAQAHMPDDRKKDYWHKIINGTQAMTTEDISVVARWLDVSPFDFVRAVRENNLTLVNVSGGTDPGVLSPEEEQSAREAFGLAARRRAQKADQQGG